MKTYPVCLVGLQSHRVVVIGGGEVAARKIHSLLTAEAKLEVISPELVPSLQALASQGNFSHIARTYHHGDLQGAFLVIAATDEPAVNQSVWAEAQSLGCLVNVVDDPEHSNFFVPAVVQRGELTIAVSTGGSSPALARRVREQLEKTVEAEYGVLADLLGALRPEIRAAYPTADRRKEAALRIIDSDILDIIKNQGKEAALTYARERIHPSN